MDNTSLENILAVVVAARCNKIIKYNPIFLFRFDKLFFSLKRKGNGIELFFRNIGTIVIKLQRLTLQISDLIGKTGTKQPNHFVAGKPAKIKSALKRQNIVTVFFGYVAFRQIVADTSAVLESQDRFVLCCFPVSS
jgi:hypothetical protein